MKSRRWIYLFLIGALTLLTACVRAASISAVSPETPTSLPAGQSAQSTLVSAETPASAATGAASQLPAASAASSTPRPAITEHEVHLIELAGPIQSPDAEISGMTWYQDTLLLLPQYPERFGDQAAEGYLFAIPKAVLLDYLDGKNTSPITPQPIPFISNEVGAGLRNYEGFESIAVSGDQAYLTIETGLPGTQGYLVTANILAGLQAVVVNSTVILEIPSQVSSPNHSYESLLVFGRRLVALHEINGAKLNPAPSAPIYGVDLSAVDSLAFPNIEYRVTDASEVDDNGRFWIINYFFPGDLALYADDPLAEEYGVGETHQQGIGVERLLEMQFTEAGIVLAPDGYLLLKLDTAARNWEALARLDQRGFLIATDKFPATLFGFIEFPTTP
jgi:hypothetical protein